MREEERRELEELIPGLVRQITDKKMANALYEQGAFGNRTSQWPSLEALEASEYRGSVCIRYKEGGSPWCLYWVPFQEIRARLQEMAAQGAKLELFYFTETAQQDRGTRVIFQGEVIRSEHYFDLRYSLRNAVMREALAKEEKQAQGLEALLLLRYYLCPNSFADLEAIFDLWPDHIVEFTTFDRNLGIIPNRNTIFWEVRNYQERDQARLAQTLRGNIGWQNSRPSHRWES